MYYCSKHKIPSIQTVRSSSHLHCLRVHSTQTSLMLFSSLAMHSSLFCIHNVLQLDFWLFLHGYNSNTYPSFILQLSWWFLKSIHKFWSNKKAVLYLLQWMRTTEERDTLSSNSFLSTPPLITAQSPYIFLVGVRIEALRNSWGHIFVSCAWEMRSSMYKMWEFMTSVIANCWGCRQKKNKYVLFSNFNQIQKARFIHRSLLFQSWISILNEGVCFCFKMLEEC